MSVGFADLEDDQTGRILRSSDRWAGMGACAGLPLTCWSAAMCVWDMQLHQPVPRVRAGLAGAEPDAGADRHGRAGAPLRPGCRRE